MMKTKKYIPILLLGTMLASCEHQEPFLFDSQNNGIYFNESSSGFQRSVNFADQVLNENCTDTTISVSTRVLGHLTETDRKFTIQSDSIEGIALPQFSFPAEMIIPAGEHEINFPVTIKRPAKMDSTYAFRLLLNQIEGESDFGSGITGQNEFNIYVSESYQKPATWQDNIKILGEWSIDKQIFLCRVAGNANLEEALNQQATTPKNLSVMAVDSIRKFYANNPGKTLSFNMPFYYKASAYDDYTPYSMPTYWGEEQIKWVGPYNPYIFAAISDEAQINTANEYELWNNIDQSRGNSYNKRAVETMLAIYNSASVNKPELAVTERFGIPIIEGVTYSFQNCIPSSWKNGKDLLAPYYGEYKNPMFAEGREKYTFMLNALYQAKKDSDPKFCLYLMFPVIQKTQDGKITYILTDEAFKDTEYATAVDALRDFNRIFREADVNNKYGFPIVENIQ